MQDQQIHNLRESQKRDTALLGEESSICVAGVNTNCSPDINHSCGMSRVTELSRIIGQRLRSAREARRMTRPDVTRRIRVKPNAMAHHEEGRSPPTLSLLHLYAQTYGVPLGWLTGADLTVRQNGSVKESNPPVEYSGGEEDVPLTVRADDIYGMLYLCVAAGCDAKTAQSLQSEIMGHARVVAASYSAVAKLTEVSSQKRISLLREGLRSALEDMLSGPQFPARELEAALAYVEALHLHFARVSAHLP